ncbi:HNH endonuclease signature motif containing protein [Streptomyces sp. NBC_00091]|uniref:HNH endonuclease signature motif containing protein n=1 Tax=Streptomyces sp. NBC_00091 TaxID=2975648 RepID=UPI00224FD268|nr:HNH endonuclease signature motif containing protein [Streptomyces sp. NBC_00091]MCX5378166.1 HNH endonuclease [Streptomyces sp. NBC_00091]
MSQVRYTRDLLSRTAPLATSLVDLMRLLDVPLLAGPRRYVRDRLAHYGIDTSHFADEPLPVRVRQRYTEERLREAAACSDSITEMLAYMGVEPYNSAHVHIAKLLERFGIDTSHFPGRDAPSSRRFFVREEISPVVADSKSMAGVMRALGHHPFDGAARAKARRSIEEYGLSTEHFTGQGHTIGRPSPARKSPEEILTRLEVGSARTKTATLRRALDDLGVPHQCAECGTGDNWRGRRLVLEIDHVNGDRLDNRRENLRYLCPSCHSQTPTFAKRSRPAIPSQRAFGDQ